jgi:hypothetical protein
MPLPDSPAGWPQESIFEPFSIFEETYVEGL